MKGFIEVTLVSENGEKLKRLVNLAEIAWIQKDGAGTYIRCRDLGGFTVSEPYAEVKGMITFAAL